jgi:hypothetical protein
MHHENKTHVQGDMSCHPSFWARVDGGNVNPHYFSSYVIPWETLVGPRQVLKRGGLTMDSELLKETGNVNLID